MIKLQIEATAADMVVATTYNNLWDVRRKGDRAGLPAAQAAFEKARDEAAAAWARYYVQQEALENVQRCGNHW